VSEGIFKDKRFFKGGREEKMAESTFKNEGSLKYK
jgi:hypothetical protein